MSPIFGQKIHEQMLVQVTEAGSLILDNMNCQFISFNSL